MARNQAAFDQLEKIKGTLIGIRDSQALKDVEADSDVAKGLAGVFGGVSDVLTQNSKGIASSNSARNAVTNGEQVVNTRGNSALDAMSKLRQENAKLQSAFEAEKSTREGLESDKSIGDQKTNQELLDIIAGLQSGNTTTGTTAGTGAGTGGGGAGGTAPDGATTDADGNVGGIDTEGDAVAQALFEDFNNQQSIMQEQLSALAAFVDAEDDDVQSSLRNIQATADLQSKRVAKENERLAQASQVAGIVAGRGMYSPYEHEGIISEVIQDGLDRITQIELTAQDAKLEAKKAHREFRYEAFVQSTEMVSALSELKRQTIVDIGKRLQEVEAAEREKMTFDQEQQDRTSFILAAELADATPEEIRAAALANGVDAGALMRTVADYKQEQDMNNLDRQVAEESILSSQQSRRLAQARFNNEQADRAASGENEDQTEPMSADTIKKFTELYNLGDVDDKQTVSAIPPYWSEEDLMAFMQDNPETDPDDLKSEMKIWEAKQIVNQLPEDQQADFIESTLQEEGRDFPTVSQKVKNLVTGDHKQFVKAAKDAGLTDWYDWFGLKDEVKTWINTPAAEGEIQRLYDLGYAPNKIQQELLSLYGKQKD